MKVRANLNLSMNTGDEKGLGPMEYVCGEVYDISEELYEDNRDHFTPLDQKEKTMSRAVDELIAQNTRQELNDMAEKVGIDTDKYNNKTQLAEAIVEEEERDDNE